MTLEGGGDVFGAYCLAIVEFDAVADLQRPHLGVVGRADLFGDAVFQRAVGREFDDHLAPHLAEGERHLRHEQRRIEAVGRFTADQAGFYDSALDRSGSARGTRKQRVGKCRGDAESGGTAQKITPAELADSYAMAQEFQFLRHAMFLTLLGADRANSYVYCCRNIERKGNHAARPNATLRGVICMPQLDQSSDGQIWSRATISSKLRSKTSVSPS